MGFREKTLNLTMRLFLSVLFCGAALALPNGRVLRPEEHWRPAAARDISKYTPRHALVNAKSSQAENSYIELARSLRANNLSKSTKKASVYDLQSECGIEGPPAQDKIVGGFEAEPNQWPWQVALFIDMPGSVVELSSLRTMSSPLLTVLMELHTSTSWPELTT